MADSTLAERERFRSRLGFILISAGCAIGLGNIWRFPYIVGEYGGAAFVVMYLVFLVILGLPVLVMEFSIGRASQRSMALAFDTLQPNRKWHWYAPIAYAGNLLLMMFYTTVCGWFLNYIVKMASGEFNGLDASQVGGLFDTMLANPSELVSWMLLTCFIGFFVCALGLQKGVERVTKFMMIALLAILMVLVVRAVTLPGAQAGLEFYLLPDFGALFQGATPGEQMGHFGEAVYAALGQAFFTLSIGMGGMEIFGSYIGRERSLTGEAVRVCALDTFVAIMGGLIIFPACLAFGVNPDAGPSLVFVTLPNVFNMMPLGQLWGSLFFLFMGFAALSTVIAVFENIISFGMDMWQLPRKQVVWRTAIMLTLLSLPCALGFNILSGCVVPGIGDIQSVEDFIVSNNILPLGGLVIALFCTRKVGWGWDNFIAEADAGTGMKFPKWLRGWVTWGIPAVMILIFIMGYAPKFAFWLGLA
ncbi:MAG: sodium-dependent transporter [Coriobacteriia bacterium]|nr:sodium-dependent transporter [Coriobacteriia bacterium]